MLGTEKFARESRRFRKDNFAQERERMATYCQSSGGAGKDWHVEQLAGRVYFET